MTRFTSIIISIAVLIAAPQFGTAETSRASMAPLPNILWITSEDNGPQLGCYGDSYSDTPNIDSLARDSLLFETCWSNAPVCAPARTTLITGMYASSLGAQHMRSMVDIPKEFKLFPQYLRQAGYYCTNNSKEDFNVVKHGKVWDANGRNAHYRNRKLGQPFFSVFNIGRSHESQIRNRPHQLVHDPAKVRVPAYHPDVPEVRRDWAQYYDRITQMDKIVGQRLKELKEAGLENDTIVFYFGDHGPGMPRSKRSPCNSGLHVPLLIRVPEKFRKKAGGLSDTGTSTDRPVGFVDFAPTVLALAGIQKPDHFQGQNFLNEEFDQQRLLFGFRGRMDERYDMIRSVRAGPYVYIRNFQPERIYGQHVEYMFQTPTTTVWKKMFDAGKLNSIQNSFWQTKLVEELYDLNSDPDEVKNLAGSPEHNKILKRLRAQLKQHLKSTYDLGFLPEPEMHARSESITPFQLARKPDVPYEQLIDVAYATTNGRKVEPEQIRGWFQDEESGIRYWAVKHVNRFVHTMGGPFEDELAKLMNDPSSSVKLSSAEALARLESGRFKDAAIEILIASSNINTSDPYLALTGLNALDFLDERVASKIHEIESLPTSAPNIPPRVAKDFAKLVRKIVKDIKADPED